MNATVPMDKIATKEGDRNTNHVEDYRIEEEIQRREES